jgi:curved DNA-binding protein CbpA
LTRSIYRRCYDVLNADLKDLGVFSRINSSEFFIKEANMKRQADGFHDWYRIMQVHHLAEPEVIEGAYKRLSKKYHPDTNKESGAEAKMKLINQAYGVLSDAKQRKAYDQLYLLRLEERQKNREKTETQSDEQHQLVRQAAAIVKNYFAHLSQGEFDSAYALISSEDQRQIKKAEFLEWQGLVSRLYEIGEYQCVFFKTYRGKETGNNNFTEVFEFQVSMTERERKSGKVNQEEFSRLVVREKNEIKLYLGYQDIQALIAKFKQMNAEYTYSDEPGSDRPWLIKEIKREMARAARYNRPLALVLLEVARFPWLEEREAGPEDYETVMSPVLRTITRHLRQVDYCGRWSRHRIMLILPETRFFAATKVVEKIFGVLKALEDRSDGTKTPTFCAGIVQYKQMSLEELTDLLYANTIAAKKRGEWRMVF